MVPPSEMQKSPAPRAPGRNQKLPQSKNSTNRTFRQENKDLIPADLRERAQWICWRFVAKPGESKLAKIPTDPATGRNLRGYTQGAGWMSFEEAARAYERNPALSGLGFVLSSDDPVVGIDMDGCRDPSTGELAPWAQRHIDDFGSAYVEVSPSGKGVRIFCRGSLPTDHPKNDRQGRELYTTRRFLTVSAAVIGTPPAHLPDRTEALRRYTAAMKPDQSPEPVAQPASSEAVIPEGGRDNALTAIAGRLRRDGFDASEIEAALRAINARRCQPPLPEADIERIARSVGRYAPARSLDQLPRAEPIDLRGARLTDLWGTAPKRREFVIDGFLPLGVVALLAGQGGIGKSMLLQQLCVAVASGQPWVGMPVSHPGAVLLLSAEDDADELRRRLANVWRHVVETYETPPFCDDDDDPLFQAAVELGDRLYAKDVVGLDNRLTIKNGRDITRSELPDRLVEAVQKLDNPRLVVLDPLSRFDGGDGNDNSDATRLVEAAEYVRTQTGCTVLLSHHVNKGAIHNAAGQAGVRGASALVDGTRWVALLHTLEPNRAAEYGLDPERARDFVHLSVPKSNYAAPFGGLWLRRLQSGVLARFDLAAERERARAAREENQGAALLPQIQELIRTEGPRSRTALESRLHPRAAVRAAVEAGLRKGQLVRVPGVRRGHLLDVPGATVVPPKEGEDA